MDQMVVVRIGKGGGVTITVGIKQILRIIFFTAERGDMLYASSPRKRSRVSRMSRWYYGGREGNGFVLSENCSLMFACRLFIRGAG